MGRKQVKLLLSLFFFKAMGMYSRRKEEWNKNAVENKLVEIIMEVDGGETER